MKLQKVRLKNPESQYVRNEDAIFSDMMTHLYAVVGAGGKVTNIGGKKEVTHGGRKYFEFDTKHIRSFFPAIYLNLSDTHRHHLDALLLAFPSQY